MSRSTSSTAACSYCGYPVDDDPCKSCDGGPDDAHSGQAARTGPGFYLLGFIDGFLSLLVATFRLMTGKEYRGKLVLAMLVNFLLLCVFAGGIFFATYKFLPLYVDLPQSMAAALAVALALLVTFFLAPALISVGITPFLEPIANATEIRIVGEKMKPVELGFFRNLLAGINTAVQVLLLQIVVLVPILLLALIPVIGLFFVALGLVLSAYLNAIVWFEIPVLRRGHGMRYRRRIVRRNWPRALGFGLAFNLGMLIPVFNFLLLGPATAVAVSTLYFRFDKSV